ncbi:ornithine cyclodeaminase family protein [Pseudoroseicyclus aestuarii]|uniref:Ornithine cyclodeaminase n=1 Tax=Pseudoroseicyclus aestuarii TaxID=1795041 RepID=A0A318SVA5_9RHOB|nr:ornithine cyclodeaminase [Pseudoroseicyclus aestuarii]PYE84289.1 ornithine cyclodeaminase [Pseudoroseicyclus aestuarii]
MTRLIGPEVEDRLDWLSLTRALAEGHERPPAEVRDSFIQKDGKTLLTRSAWIDGLGIAVKVATVFPENPAAGKPAVGGVMSLLSDADGALEAVIDFHLVTKWKTAGDSLLAATRLARPDSRNILIVGAGTVGQSLRQAYGAAFPEARFTLWNRSAEGAERFRATNPDIEIATDLETAVAQADIVTVATMAKEPVIRGDWLRPGQHIDLIGAFTPEMREADDTALQRARIFVDSRETVMGHIGELAIPLASGAIDEAAVLADYRDLGAFRRESDEEITLFKNGGGAHLDLMTGRYILDAAG